MKLALPDNNRAAARYLLLANTPLFVVRKLKKDHQVIRLSENSDAGTLLDGFNRATAREPSDIYQEVDPYIYLVALFMKGTGDLISKAAANENIGNFKWLKFIIDYMQKNLRPSQSLTFEFPQPKVTPTFSVTTRAD